MSIYVSSGAFGNPPVAELLERADRANVNRLELASGLAISSEDRHRLVEVAKEFSFLVHNYVPAPTYPFVLNLAAEGAIQKRRSLDLARDAMDLCVELSAPFYSLHAGFATPLSVDQLGHPETQRAVSKAERDRAWDRFLRGVFVLAEEAATRGIGLLIENNVSPREVRDEAGISSLFLSDAEGIEMFFKQLNDSNVGLLLDTGHLAVSANANERDPREELELIRPYVKALHLSDNDGLLDQNQPITRESWFYPLLASFASLPAVIEVYQLTDEKITNQLELMVDARKPMTGDIYAT
ncbi:xylose isomerase-like TIM barrel [bacterium BMS3Bbin04]|nr:xylose isomerase-like TIM barrel [bacterium BMS3Bbin04]